MSVPFSLESWIMNRLSLQCCRNACQHRLVGHFLSRRHRSIDVTHNEAETERGFFSWLCPAAFSTHKHTYEAIEPPCFFFPAPLLPFCALLIGPHSTESGMERQRRGKERRRIWSLLYFMGPALSNAFARVQVPSRLC